MVGSVVASDDAGGAACPGVFVAGTSLAGASGVGAGCVGAGGDVCAKARALSAARTHNAKAHRRNATPAPQKGAQHYVPATRYDPRPPGKAASQSRFVKSIGAYDDVNKSSYRTNPRTAMQRVTITIDDDLATGPRTLHRGARLRQSLRGDTRSRPVRPAARRGACRRHETVPCSTRLCLRPPPARIAETAYAPTSTITTISRKQRCTFIWITTVAWR